MRWHVSQGRSLSSGDADGPQAQSSPGWSADADADEDLARAIAASLEAPGHPTDHKLGLSVAGL